MKISSLFLVLICLTSCKDQHTNCSLTDAELMKKDADKVIGTNKNINRIDEYRDRGLDSIIGGYYTFYPDGNLKNYQFFVDTITYSYSEDYSQEKELIKVEGSPFLYSRIKTINTDSFFYTIYFFALNKDYENLNIDAMNGKSFSIKMRSDSLYSNMLSASFGLNIKGYDHPIIHFNTKMKNLCTNNVQLVTDSIGFRIIK